MLLAALYPLVPRRPALPAIIGRAGLIAVPGIWTPPPPYIPLATPAELYPYLLVNIGSGVSMVRVDGEGKFQRVSGE